MAQAINLIPQQEKHEQDKAKLTKLSTVIAIIVAVIVGLVALFFFIRTATLKKELTTYEANIEASRADIKSLEQIEVSARNLDAKYQVLKTLFADRLYYSTLLSEFAKRVPSTINIETFTLGRDQELNISGDGLDYLAISDFINTLSDPNFSGAKEGLGGLFTKVSLNTVNLDHQTTRARYFIVVEFNEGLLKR